MKIQVKMKVKVKVKVKVIYNNVCLKLSWLSFCHPSDKLATFSETAEEPEKASHLPDSQTFSFSPCAGRTCFRSPPRPPPPPPPPPPPRHSR